MWDMVGKAQPPQVRRTLHRLHQVLMEPFLLKQRRQQWLARSTSPMDKSLFLILEKTSQPGLTDLFLQATELLTQGTQAIAMMVAQLP